MTNTYIIYQISYIIYIYIRLYIYIVYLYTYLSIHDPTEAPEVCTNSPMEDISIKPCHDMVATFC